MTPAILIRAHQFTPQEALLAERLETAFGTRITFVVDESHGGVDTGRFTKISLTNKRVRELIGGRLLPQWGWQFGDLCHYAAREALCDATHFALIEADVFLSETAAAKLAKLFCDRPEDVLAAQLGHRDPPHAFARDLADLGEDNTVTCFFPITRVSTKAIDLMQALRRAERASATRLRLNDEAILAAVANRDDISAANLTEIAPDLFDPEAFTPQRTQLFEHLAQEHTGPEILHPVRSVPALLATIEQMGTARNLRARYREAISQAAPRHRQKLRKALAAADERRRAAEDA